MWALDGSAVQTQSNQDIPQFFSLAHSSLDTGELGGNRIHPSI